MDNKPRSTSEENERLRIRRKEWMLEQEFERRHEKRKKKMIAAYEMQRNCTRKNSLQRRKSDSPQRRRIISTDYKHSEESGILSRFKYEKDIIIDEKELRKIKINICNRGTFPMKDQCLSMEEIKRDIVNSDDISLPRRKDEGSCPLSERREMSTGGIIEARKIGLSRGYQSVEELSTSQERVVTCRRSPDNDRNSR